VSAPGAPAYVGLDLGTSGLKGVVVDPAGDVVAWARSDYPTTRASAGAAEQDSADWLAAVVAVVAELALASPTSTWRALGLSGMIPTLVLLDAQDRPVAPAITWEDRRAQHEGARLARRVGQRRVYELTGQRVDGRYLLSMAEHALATRPGLGERVARMVGAKDYLFGWMTGEWLTDPSTATGYGCYGLDAGAWVEEIVERAELPAGARRWLPEIAPSATARPLRADVASVLGLPTGLPVCLGGADSVLALLGLGADSPGEVAYVSGTSTVVLAAASEPHRDRDARYLVTPLAGPGWGLEMDILSTGSAIGWLARQFGSACDEAAVASMAAGVPFSDAPVFLPHLAPGEQGALWDPELTGSLVGLTLRHTRADLARGLLNGILLESRRCLAVLDEVLTRRGTVHVSGALASTRSFLADLADVSSRTVVAASSHGAGHSALGAASLASSAVDGVPLPAPTGPPPLVATPTAERGASWALVGERHDRVRAALSVRQDHEVAPELASSRPGGEDRG